MWYVLSQITDFIRKLKNDRELFSKQFVNSCSVTAEKVRLTMRATESSRVVTVCLQLLEESINRASDNAFVSTVLKRVGIFPLDTVGNMTDRACLLVFFSSYVHYTSF